MLYAGRAPVRPTHPGRPPARRSAFYCVRYLLWRRRKRWYESYEERWWKWLRRYYTSRVWKAVRWLVMERDGWRCTVHGCTATIATTRLHCHHENIDGKGAYAHIGRELLHPRFRR